MPFIETKPELQLTTNAEKIDYFRVKFPDVTKEIETELFTKLTLGELKLSDKKNISKYVGKTLSQVEKIIDNLLKQQKIVNELDVLPKTQYEFVDAYIAKNKLEMIYNEIFINHAPIKYEDKIVDEEKLKKYDEKTRQMVTGKHVKEFTKSTLLECMMHCAANLDLEYKDKEIDAALNFYITNKKREIEGDLINKVIEDKPKPCEELWDELVNNITDVNHEETKIMMKHFIWQVKRKMMNLPVDYHNMIVLFGSFQGTGKSEFMKRFVQPISDLTTNGNFEVLSDDRFFNYYKYYVIMFDEMSKAEKSDIENVKRVITSTTMTVKPLFGNKLEHLTNKSTMIGTSNRDLSQIINDNTGMRRFYQIDCKTVFDHEFINSFDYKKLWKTIDHTKASPFSQDANIQQSIIQIQNSKRQKSDIEQFLETYHSKDRISTKDLFLDFIDWLKECNPGYANKYSIRFFNTRLEIDAQYVKNVQIINLNKKKDGYDTYKIIKI